MIFIGGKKEEVWEEGQEEGYCEQCGRETIFTRYKVSKKATAFFVSVMEYSSERFWQCNICGLRCDRLRDSAGAAAEQTNAADVGRGCAYLVAIVVFVFIFGVIFC